MEGEGGREEGRKECALCKTRDYSHRTLSQSARRRWHGGGHLERASERARMEEEHSKYVPCQPIPSSLLSLSRDVVVVVLYRFSRQRMCTRHDATPVRCLLPSVAPSLNRSSAGDTYASGRRRRLAGERSSEKLPLRDQLDPPSPRPTPSPSPRSNNRQFMRRAPLLFTPQQRRRRLPVWSARPSGHARRKR